eukprot:13896608-Ditylum_brightwellii.AAC.1
MRLCKAVFFEEYQDMFIKRNNLMTRQELDAMIDYEEEDREKVYTTLTPDRIKTLFREARDKMNQAMERWKAPGNGAGNKKKN